MLGKHVIFPFSSINYIVSVDYIFLLNITYVLQLLHVLMLSQDQVTLQDKYLNFEVGLKWILMVGGLQRTPVNLIGLVQEKVHNKWAIKLSSYYILLMINMKSELKSFTMEIYHINRIITSSVIRLSGLLCISIFTFVFLYEWNVT